MDHAGYKFCPKCALPLAEASHKAALRLQCPSCGFVLHRNPIVGMAAIVMDGRKLLLGRRSASGGLGQWCIPCGYVEWGEDIREAASRETIEETGLDVRIGDVYAVHSNFHTSQSLTVGIWFRAEAVGGSLQAGDDLDQVGFFALDDLPGPMAFPTDLLVLARLRKEG